MLTDGEEYINPPMIPAETGGSASQKHIIMKKCNMLLRQRNINHFLQDL
jgi:hypothetical protein